MSEAVGVNNDKKSRPQFNNIGIFDIVRYRMPLAGLVSILHRISGAFMFLLLPFILYLLDKSIMSEVSFTHMQGIASHWFVKLVILALSWSYLHHFAAGVRHLFMDMHMGITKEGSRRSSATVLTVSLLLTLAVALKLFGVF
jgi:succinate dehydrogenase / fumarate reductase cytochrome b subunit